MWRWLCATGVYHAAANTVTVENLYEIGRAGGTVEEYLCQHQHVCERCEPIRRPWAREGLGSNPGSVVSTSHGDRIEMADT